MKQVNLSETDGILIRKEEQQIKFTDVDWSSTVTLNSQNKKVLWAWAGPTRPIRIPKRT